MPNPFHTDKEPGTRESVRGPGAALPPTLILGTAMWGWTTTTSTACNLLDEWYALGFREIDGATNYPIDKNPSHFRMAEKILLDWIVVNGISDLKLIMKIGSVNNLFTPEHLLTRSFLLMMLDEYDYLFGENLHTIMVHWDNRENVEAIQKTMEALSFAEEKGYRVGLSGIRHPEIYAGLNKQFNLDLRIQIKHNVMHSDYDRYALFHGQDRFITYGINAGGLKLDTSTYTPGSTLKTRGGQIDQEPPVVPHIRDLIKEANHLKDRPPILAFHQVGMINAFYHPDIGGILLGPSKVEQLRESIAFYDLLQGVDYSDLYKKIRLLRG